VNPESRPASLVAERAVRLLRRQGGALPSTAVVREVLATRIADESAARVVLESAFSGDPRLAYADGAWRLPPGLEEDATGAAGADSDHVLLVLLGERPARRAGWRLNAVAGVRIHGGSVVSACGGAVGPGASGERLASTLREMLRDATPVVHDPPGSVAALERWLGQPLDSPLSLRRLATRRLGLPARHGLADLAAALGIRWRETDDPLDRAEALEWALEGLKRPGDTLLGLRAEAAGTDDGEGPPEAALSPDFLARVPRAPGAYRFYDARGRLLYVGKSKDLQRRLASYARRGSRSPRVRAVIERLHRVEIEPTGSDLEAVLREAAQIARRRPERNVQRRVRVRLGRTGRLRSVLLLEAAEPPWVLRAYLLRDGRLVDRVPLGPRGGGLARVGRLLDAYFFELDEEPPPPRGEPVDVELVGRWLAAHREQVVAFDPTHLRTSAEVVARLRWFLGGGPLLDPTGRPVLPR
jgi:hypothetical protein